MFPSPVVFCLSKCRGRPGPGWHQACVPWRRLLTCQHVRFYIWFIQQTNLEMHGHWQHNAGTSTSYIGFFPWRPFVSGPGNLHMCNFLGTHDGICLCIYIYNIYIYIASHMSRVGLAFLEQKCQKRCFRFHWIYWWSFQLNTQGGTVYT